jgi:hypothetical protein
MEGPENEVNKGLRHIPEVIDVSIRGTLENNTTNFTIKTTNPYRAVKEITKLARERNWDIIQLYREHRSLEDVFHEILLKGKEK